MDILKTRVAIQLAMEEQRMKRPAMYLKIEPIEHYYRRDNANIHRGADSARTELLNVAADQSTHPKSRRSYRRQPKKWESENLSISPSTHKRST
jgi:hypothetical protein